MLFCVLIVFAWSNAVNFTDGLDGLAAGAMAMVCAAYVIITLLAVPQRVRDGARRSAATTCGTRWISP